MDAQKWCRFGVLILVAGLLAAGCAESPARKAHRQGLQAFKRGRYEQSAALLQRSLELGGDPATRAERYNELGLALRQLSRLTDARAAFEQSAGLDDTLAEPVYNKGVLLVEEGRWQEALDCFKTAADRNASDSLALCYGGWLLLENQRWDEAREVLTEAQRRAPRNPWVLTALALLDLQANRLPAAIAGLQSALEYNARYGPALYNLARVNQQWLKNEGQAEALFEEFLRLDPGGEPAAEATRALTTIRAARAAAQPQKTVKPSEPSQPVRAQPAVPATGQSETARAFEPVTAEDRLRVAELMVARGRREAAVNNYLLAAREADQSRRPTLRDRALRAARVQSEGNPVSCYELGLLYIELAQPVEALTCFKEAAALSNDWFEAHMELAQVAAAGGEFDAAVVAARQADQSQPDNPEGLWLLAQIYDQRLGLTERAVDSYRQFIKRFGNDERADDARTRLLALGVELTPDELKPRRSRWSSFFREREAAAH